MQKITKSYVSSLEKLNDKLTALLALHSVPLANMTLRQKIDYEKLSTDVKQIAEFLAKYKRMW